MGLTEEQKKRIEENRMKALAKRQENQSTTNVTASASLPKKPSVPVPTTTTKQGMSASLATVSLASIAIYQNKAPVTSQINKPSTTGFTSQTFFGSGSKRTESGQQKSASSASSAASAANPFTKVVKGHCVIVSSKMFRVEMPYNAAAIDVFKTIPSGRYNVTDRQWSFSIDHHEDLIRKLRNLKPGEIQVEPLPRMVVNVLSKVAKNKTNKTPVSVNTDQAGSFQIDSDLWDCLMPFQREGVLFALQRDGRVLLADDMGLGKTVQALAIAAAFRSEWPLLIVCPSSMRFAWKTAILKWMSNVPEHDIHVITGGRDFLCDVRVIIINYDLLSRKKDELVQKMLQVIVFDECHFLKSSKSQRCKAAEVIAKSAKRMILLSGTPALSRPSELYSQISLVDSAIFPYFHDFGMRYCNGKKVLFGGKEGFDFSGSSNMQELKLILEESCMIRRMKSEVISQLPSKQRQVVLLDPNMLGSKNRGEMQSQAKQMMSESLSKQEKRGLLLEWFHKTAPAKEKAVLEYIKDLLESGKKFICFAHHQVMIRGIAQLLEKEKVGFILIDGATSAFNREQFCKEFQTQDNKQVALLSITAANAGITLTAAQLVIFAELFWNPGILIQAEDRAHRIGQTCSVVVQYLVAKGTADDELWPMIQHKLDVLSKVGLGNENFLNKSTENILQKARKSPGKEKITDYFSTSISEEDFEKIFDDDSFEVVANTSGAKVEGASAAANVLDDAKNDDNVECFFEDDFDDEILAALPADVKRQKCDQ